MVSEKCKAINGRSNDNDVTNKPHQITLEQRLYSLAKRVDNNQYFHSVYGAFDALSVVYSTTIKFPCDVISSTPEEYKESLSYVLHDPVFLAAILFETLIIGAISVMGNAALKQKNASSPVKLCVTAWPYMRDIFKGMKNSYKGVKGSVSMLTAMNMLSANSARTISLPVGLVMGAICIVNRTWNRRMNDARKRLLKSNDQLIDDLTHLNSFLRSKQELKQRIYELNKIKQQAEKLKAAKPANEAEITKNKSILDYLLYKPEQSLMLDELENMRHKATSMPASHPYNKKYSKLLQAYKALNLKDKQPLSLEKRLKDLNEELDAKKLHQTQLDALRFAEVIVTLVKSSPNDKKAIDFLLPKNETIDRKAQIENLEKQYKNIDKLKKTQDKLKNNQDKTKIDKKLKENKSELNANVFELNAKSNELIEYLKTQKVNYKNFAKYYIFGDQNRYIKGKYISETETLKEFMIKHKYRLLISNCIAGIVDAPYLYVGVMGLAVLNGALLIAMSSIVTSFLIASVFCRVFEEQEKQRKTEIKLLDSDFAYKANELIYAQNAYQKSVRKLSNSDYNVCEKSYNSNKATLSKAFNNWLETFNTLKAKVKPSYYRATLTGIKHGLSAFGALASIYYATAIVLMLASIHFPPFLLVAGIIAGLATIAYFVTIELNRTNKDKIHFNAYCNKEEDFANNYKDSEDLSLLWLNVKAEELDHDGLPLQEAFNTVRASFSGVGKGKNLEDMAMPEADYHSKFSGFLSLALAALYGSVLGLRALATGFAKKDNKTNPDDNNKETLDLLVKNFEKDQPPSEQVPESFRFLKKSSLFALSRPRTPTPVADSSQDSPTSSLIATLPFFTQTPPISPIVHPSPRILSVN